MFRYEYECGYAPANAQAQRRSMKVIPTFLRKTTAKSLRIFGHVVKRPLQRLVRWRLQVPPGLDGVAYDFLWIIAKLSKLCSKDLDVPPRTRWIAAWAIRVSLMLKLKVKAEPVHAFK